MYQKLYADVWSHVTNLTPTGTLPPTAFLQRHLTDKWKKWKKVNQWHLEAYVFTYDVPFCFFDFDPFFPAWSLLAIYISLTLRFMLPSRSS